jgi:hypothetical protein
MLRWILAGVGLLLVVALLVLWVSGRGLFGRADSVGARPAAAARTPEAVARAEQEVRAASEEVGIAQPRQILFGDLHVHSTISFDAFMFSLPVMGGEGAHPPADACDFARHCAALDFWSINDHAANITPRDWSETIASIRECNARAGDPANPDVVAFLGWEWTQMGSTADAHYGHKNVVLAGTGDDEIPLRPIAASRGGTASNPPPTLARGAIALGAGGRFHDLALRWTEVGGVATCEEAPVRDLPADCREIAPTPATLFAKLDDWGHDSLVIPHGTAWGIYTPPDSSWDKQLVGTMHDPARQSLIEVYSGHGDGEPYRDWRPIGPADADGPTCPEARPDYLPMCQRAGQIVEARCTEEGLPEAECAERAERARRHAAAAGVSPHVVVPGTTGADWLDAGQCRDCDQPAFKYRPSASAQYIAALGGFDEDGAPRRFRMGFMASSDIHSARAGTGYKEVHRRGMTDANGDRPSGGVVASFFSGAAEEPEARSRPIEEAARELTGLQLFETERPASFLYTGGLVAVHAEGRDRPSIWTALKRREVYGTSGPRILLWFDLLNPPDAPPGRRLPMGGEAVLEEAPIFQVRAVGSFEQQPGCGPDASEALGPDALERLCKGECYRPSDRRRRVTRIEVVRIRPQQTRDEDVTDLVEDPWQTFACEPDPAGCVATFTDTDFPAAGRETLYYVRAYEEPTPTINAGGLRCERGPDGACTSVRLCGVGDEARSDCLAPYEPRAWSSPIWIDPPPAS